MIRCTTLKEANELLDILIKSKKICEDEVEKILEELRRFRQKPQKKIKRQKQKKDPFANCRMRHIALQIAYDGGPFNGFAQNVGSPDDNSVEKFLFEALVKCCLVKDRASSSYTRCGRTDKGVSAFGQIIGLTVRSAIPLRDGNDNSIGEELLPNNSSEPASILVKQKVAGGKKENSRDANGSDSEKIELKEIFEMDFCQMLNNVLPEEIRAIGWAPVTEGFSARFSAKDRMYRYFFAKRDLNLEAMRNGLSYIIGNHDFRNLAKMDTESVTNFRRLILDTKIVENAPALEASLQFRDVPYFEIKGQAFLWHMVRCIVAVSFLVGKGLESSEVFKKLLDIETNPAKPSYLMASDLPLVLHQCSFHNLTIGHTVNNLWDVSCHLEARWEKLALGAARARNAIDSLEIEAKVRSEDVLSFIRRKLAKRNESLKNSDELCTKDDVITWREALEIIRRATGSKPDPEKESNYIKLMERSRGTTYEEKINGMKGRKRAKYEENMKKQKSAEEDKAFYDRMSKLGGNGV